MDPLNRELTVFNTENFKNYIYKHHKCNIHWLINWMASQFKRQLVLDTTVSRI